MADAADRLPGFELLIHRLNALSLSLAMLEERVSVLEERTIDHDLRIEDLEEWRIYVDEKIEGMV